MSGMGGSYPGGPRRKAGDSEKIGEHLVPHAPRVEPAEDIEARITEGQKGVGHRRRHKRLLSGLLAAMLLAAGIGVFLGYRTHRTSEEITNARNATQEPKAGFDPTFQTNRILDELWKMEMKQRQPGPP